MIKCVFELQSDISSKIHPINSRLVVKPNNDNISYGYKINNYLGDGTVGNVYLLESYNNNKNYVIKISKSCCKKDLINELQIFSNFLKKNTINHKIFPIFYGDFDNSKDFGIIYPYLGQYNFDKFKTLHINKLSFKNNIQILKQIIQQLISFDTIIHCDLKTANIIIDIHEENLIATITDMGLSNLIIPNRTVLSTNYITSPESLLTLPEFYKLLVDKKELDIKKHDYFGIFSIILNLFMINNYWNILSNYLVSKLKMDIKFLVTQQASIIYVYIWYKFNNSHSNNQSLKNVILAIEKTYPEIIKMDIINFETFFKLYIVPNLNLNIINNDQILLLYDFLVLLIKFDPIDRPSLEVLLLNPFLQAL